ncbi:NlpC/P60 family protein [Mucilaginibacter terrigena]|uniref:NlpC/P60 family protein n=1 Tax=Mucilaginibacter terrigena TaxID=2492395 RepID=A0A4Q5LLE0_9SPHI|nr:C40 family peptidase [Mucilaginibacter terrigena]RYU89512.1 NlpC/P60 family protein [Mucilaginibacter terrigena]
MRFPIPFAFLLFTLLSCGGDKPTYTITAADTVTDTAGRKTVILAPTDGTADMNHINTGSTTPAELIAFARTAMGIPYKYGSTDPQQGFDCSGFITYVFNHFGIAVPRTSADFTNVDHEVPLKDARAGDLILFTGTDSTVRIVGHMGIVITNPNEELQFIHSTSGRDNGVTISVLTKGYQERFVKVVRIFE